MKKFIYILTAFITLASCTGLRDADPYTDDLHTLIVTTQWPELGVDHSGADVRVDDMNTGRCILYTAKICGYFFKDDCIQFIRNPVDDSSADVV